MTRIVDTRAPGFPLITGLPCTDYNADEEFLYQMNKYFCGLMHFEIASRKGGRSSRVDFLLKGNFVGEGFSNNIFYLYVFILYEGGNGRAHDDELRTQLGAHSVWTPDLAEIKAATNFRDYSGIDLQNKECYCIGIYKQDEASHNVVFVGMPAEVLCKSENESINPTSAFQTYGEYVQKAYEKGIYLHEKKFNASSTNNLLLFRPEYFLWYMKHRDELHIGDIDKACSLIKDVQRIYTNPIRYEVTRNCNAIIKFLTALRTKPFLLLAGISGTGKSRIVRKLAHATVTEELQRKYDKEYQGANFREDRWSLHSPANFQLIQVKPNWHNSMDVVGYFSNIPNPHYVFTPFVEFIVRAWQNPDIPFFLCLDEMNLAPVEEYFAEFLSAIESRGFEKDENGKKRYMTDPIIKPFKEFGTPVAGDMMKSFNDYLGENIDKDVESLLLNKGLTLPANLMVIGTVNMDETTFSFSRKVLDRAMSIEMNEVDYDSFLQDTTDDGLKEIVADFEAGKYGEGVTLNGLLVNRPIEAKDIIGKLGEDAQTVIEYLKKINSLLEGTPFKLGYRAANEALIYLLASYDFGQANRMAALDRFTMMKILSRVEGDEAKLKLSLDSKTDQERLDKAGIDVSEATKYGDLNLLTALRYLFVSTFGETDNGEWLSVKKTDTMIAQLGRDHFVSYWN